MIIVVLESVVCNCYSACRTRNVKNVLAWLNARGYSLQTVNVLFCVGVLVVDYLLVLALKRKLFYSVCGILELCS